MGVMDKILILIAVFLFLFICLMVYLYIRTGGIPDTLVTCVFAICGSECGAMGWIQTTKTRTQDRKVELEDRKSKEDETNG
jgi:hypothetical protein